MYNSKRSKNRLYGKNKLYRKYKVYRKTTPYKCRCALCRPLWKVKKVELVKHPRT